MGFQSVDRGHRHDDAGRQARVPHLRGLAEFERNLIRERTKAGLEAARAGAGKGAGRSAFAATESALVVEFYEQRKLSIEEICRSVGISKPTLYAYVEEVRVTFETDRSISQ